MGAGARIVFCGGMGSALSGIVLDTRCERETAAGRHAIHALWKGRVRVHGTFLVSRAAGGRAWGVPYLLEFSECGESPVGSRRFCGLAPDDSPFPSARHFLSKKCHDAFPCTAVFVFPLSCRA